MAPQRMFFVESYVPQLDAAGATALSTRLRAAVAELREEGLALAWIRSFALLEDDTYVWIVEAAALDDVARIQRRAGMEVDHVVEAVPGERGGG